MLRIMRAGNRMALPNREVIASSLVIQRRRWAVVAHESTLAKRQTMGTDQAGWPHLERAVGASDNGLMERLIFWSGRFGCPEGRECCMVEQEIRPFQ